MRWPFGARLVTAIDFGRRRTEVCEFQLSAVVDEQVLRLEVSVEDPPSVAVGEAAQQLEEEQLKWAAAMRQSAVTVATDEYWFDKETGIPHIRVVGATSFTYQIACSIYPGAGFTKPCVLLKLDFLTGVYKKCMR